MKHEYQSKDSGEEKDYIVVEFKDSDKKFYFESDKYTMMATINKQTIISNNITGKTVAIFTEPHICIDTKHLTIK